LRFKQKISKKIIKINNLLKTFLKKSPRFKNVLKTNQKAFLKSF